MNEALVDEIFGDGFELEDDLTKQPGVRVVDTSACVPKRAKKKPVCLSLTEAQVGRIEARSHQTGMSRSGQIQRDLSVYWFVLSEGLRRAKAVLSTDDAKYLARIFKGRAVSASDDVLWCDGMLVSYVRKSGLYGDKSIADQIVSRLEMLGELSRLALMDWIRRVAIDGKDESLFVGWMG